ncbi:hypothetical protein MRX96_053205 [Rhipicephalus microplus]
MVLLMISEDLYVIVEALVVSNDGSICIFTYYFTDDGMLKRNAPGDCNIIVTQQRLQENMPMVLMNHKGRYPIVAMLGISTPGCACVLTYSFDDSTG